MKRFTKKTLSILLSVCVLFSLTVPAVLAEDVSAISLLDETVENTWQENGSFFYAGYQSGFVISDVSPDGGDVSLDAFGFDGHYLAPETLPAAGEDAPVLPDNDLPGTFKAADIRALTDNCDDFFVTTGKDDAILVYLYNLRLDEYKYVGVFQDNGVAEDENGASVRTFNFFGRSYAVASSKEVDEKAMRPYTNSPSGEPCTQDVVATDGKDGFYAYPGDYISVGSVYLNVFDNHVSPNASLKASLLRQTEEGWVEVDSRSVTADKHGEQIANLICDFIIPMDETVKENEQGFYRIVLSSDGYPFGNAGQDEVYPSADDWVKYSIFSNSTTLWPITGIYMGLNTDALKILAAGCEFTTEDTSNSTRNITVTFIPIPNLAENEEPAKLESQIQLN